MLSSSTPIPGKVGAPDTSQVLPARRRVIWEHGMDLALGFKWALIALGCVGFAFVVQTVAVVILLNRPPVVLAQDEGYVMWRTTEVFKLQPIMVDRYLRVVLGHLYSVSPGAYDLGQLAGLVDERVLKAFAEGQDPNLVTASNQRRIYRLQAVRRWYDPTAPQFITLVVRGERALYEYNPAAANPFKVEERVVTQVVYLEQVAPTPDNPWGLVMVGLVAKTGEEAEVLWKEAKPLEKPSDAKVVIRGAFESESNQKGLFSK